ncbi:alpha/beta hydrolase [Hymenobacter sp. UV11]|uniref:alpha/beta hydrolase n=1 Tax=Hymenobacter sp. UV11 TaxID=1849735 RepID=UPI00105BEA75|nr:alpha/beta hydrolase [Hymenobacter sp. UV11]TDN39780.1 alpha/beta hydrolase [Hymenobacter sp. UV11]TFZ67099.1 alpha/beta hydrolase [Hymenobacter sp. UV11]
MKYTFRRLALPPLGLLLAAIVVLLANEWAMARASHRIADVPYVTASAPDFDAKRHLLDIYQPKKEAAPRPVVLFIHGGNWNSGSKDDILYKTIGRRLAKQGFVGVVISYRLAPQVLVPQQAGDCARALAWTVAHIKDYGGDPARIVLMGHSAGGGLAALLATGSDTLLARHALPHAVLLDDPAGLDMLDYLTKMEYPNDAQYLVPFSKDPAVWRQASALYHMRAGAPPFSLYIGGDTYPSIKSSSEKFRQRMKQLGQEPKYVVEPGKKHIPMVLQLFWSSNMLYKELHRLAE